MAEMDEQITTNECAECGDLKTSKHKPTCQTWLRTRLEIQLVHHPKLKFQISKLTPIPVAGSYPIYACYLIAPFIYEHGKHENGDYDLRMNDAMVQIRMNKADLAHNRDDLFVERRVAATHRLLDFVESGEVPAGGTSGMHKVYMWGTLEDHKEEIEGLKSRLKLVQP